MSVSFLSNMLSSVARMSYILISCLQYMLNEILSSIIDTVEMVVVVGDDSGVQVAGIDGNWFSPLQQGWRASDQPKHWICYSGFG